MLVVVVVGAAVISSPGCGDMETDPTETVHGELGSFGSWTNMGGLVFDSPALVKGPGTTYTAFGWGTDFNIWTTAQNANGQWTGNWTPLPGGAFTTRPAATAFMYATGPLANQFAIAARRSDGHYYIRIQNQSGSNVVQDWVQVVDPSPPSHGGEPWVSAPALAFVHRPVEDALVIAGKQQQKFISLLAASVDSASGNWNRFGWLHPRSSSPFLYGDTAPALAFVPTSNPDQYDFLLAVGDQTPSGITFKYLAISGLFATSDWSWSPWYFLTTGLFSSGPALAGAKNPTLGLVEWTMYGLGMDQRIYVTNKLSNDGQFSPIGSQVLGGTPTALGNGNNTHVVAMSSAVPYTTTAKSPF